MRSCYLIILTTMVFNLFSSGLSAAEEEVTLRYSVQDRNVRIVLECKTQRFVERAEVRSSYSLVKIQFPREFNFNGPKITPPEFEVNKKGPNIYLNIENLKWLKIFRLRSPPRLVIDAYLYGQRPEEKAYELKPEPERPSPAPPREVIKRVVIDPGHGGADLGIYTSTFTEKNITLRVARELRRLLIGKITILTRTADKNLGLMERIQAIRKSSPDLALSIHMGGSDIFTIYVPSEEAMRNLEPLSLAAAQMPFVNRSQRLGNIIKRHLQNAYMSKYVEVNDRLVLPLLTHVNCPVVFIELPSGDFMDFTATEINKIARAIVEALKEYEGQ